MSIEAAAIDLLAEVQTKENQPQLLKIYRDVCGSDEWDDYSQTEMTFLQILRKLAGVP